MASSSNVDANDSDLDLVTEKLKVAKNGLNDADIENLLPWLNIQQRVNVLNKLIAKGVVALFSQSNGFIYKLKSGTPEILKGADTEEMVVYELVKSAGNKGIWVRDIRVKSNLTSIQLNKILKSLENKKSIKSVKTVSAGKKKVYMLFDLEPDCSLTGGAWYSDQDFESEFVDILNNQCYRFLLAKKDKALEMAGGPVAINNMSFATVKEILKFITDLGISKVQLTESDMTTILNTLVYDDKIERKETHDGKYIYKAATSLLSLPGIVRVPCGVCPVSILSNYFDIR